MTVLVTGAAGFIGSNFVHYLRARWPDRAIVSFDALTYAGSLAHLDDLRTDARHVFVKGDVCDREAVRAVFAGHAVSAVVHLAAETHVDRSIVDPVRFIRTNVEGTTVLAQEALRAWQNRRDVRFVHVSTDEVFGSLGPHGRFDERTPYAPSSPYSASKAAADHVVRAFQRTYGLPALITNCSNNYGPRQFPEKLIPRVIARALRGLPVPVYGAGENVRDWLFVDDHCEALADVLERGAIGSAFCIGGDCELTNLDLVDRVLDVLDAALGRSRGESRRLVEFVADRPGHDLRYAIDASKIRTEIGWKPRTSIADGLARTVAWYLGNRHGEAS